MVSVNNAITNEEVKVEDVYKAQNDAFGFIDYPYLINLIHQKSSKRVLDIGTGEGSFILGLASKIQQVEFDAIDLNENLIEIAKKNNQLLGLNVNFYNATFGDDFDQSNYDLIITRFAVEHIKKIEDIESFVENTYGKLNPGGLLIIIEYYIDEKDISDPVWKKFRNSEMKMYKKLQVHPRIGLQLPLYLWKSNYRNVTSVINHLSPVTIGTDRYYKLVSEYTKLYNQLDDVIWNSKLVNEINAWCMEKTPIGDPAFFTSYTIGLKELA